MLRISSSLVGVGTPFEIELPEIHHVTWQKVSAIEVVVMSDSGDALRTFTFPRQRSVSIPTDQIEVGSYDLLVSLIGTCKIFSDSIIIGLEDMQERMRRFSEAVDKRCQAAKEAGPQRAILLREVLTVYNDLGLDDLAGEVRNELQEL